MATLRKRMDRRGKYELNYTDVDGERYRIDTKTKDKKLARMWLATAEERLSLARLDLIVKVGKITKDDVRGSRGPPVKRTLTQFKAYHESRCTEDDTQDFSKSTLALMGNAFDSFIGVVGDRPLAAIDVAMINKWKKTTLKKGRSKTTVAIYQRTLRAAFGRGVKWDWLDANPFAHVELPKTTSNRKALTLDEVQKLLEAVDEPWYMNYLQFLLYTGCRRNEVLFLKWDDIDMKRWTLRVRADKVSRILELPINKGLQRVIQSMDNGSGYVFGSTELPGKPWNEDWVTHKFKRVLQIAGLPDEYSLHSLRHTYATHLREKGVPRDIIQSLLGHSSPDTTTIYDHSDALYFRQFADMVDFEEVEGSD